MIEFQQYRHTEIVMDFWRKLHDGVSVEQATKETQQLIDENSLIKCIKLQTEYQIKRDESIQKQLKQLHLNTN